MLCTTAINTSNTITTQIECRRRNEDRVFNKQQRSYIYSVSRRRCATNSKERQPSQPDDECSIAENAATRDFVKLTVGNGWNHRPRMRIVYLKTHWLYCYFINVPVIEAIDRVAVDARAKGARPPWWVGDAIARVRYAKITFLDCVRKKR